MFEHLDDPNPPVADAAVRRAVANRAVALRRRQRSVVASTLALVVVIAGAGLGLALTRDSGHRVQVVTHPSPSTLAPPSSISVPPTTTTVTAAANLRCAHLEPAAAPGVAQTATASLGTYTAKLSGQSGSAYGNATLEHASISLLQGTQTVFSATVTPPNANPPVTVVIPWSLTWQAGQDPRAGSPMCLARFAGSTTPAVVLGLNWGGAHCCTVVRVVEPPSGTPVELELGNAGASVADSPSGALIVTGDQTFYYAFAPYAQSAAPVQIFEIQGGKAVDTTRRHLDFVSNDAMQWLAAFNANAGNGLGYLAGWVGDECLLGNSTTAWASVEQYNAQGKLSGPSGWPTGSAYVNSLKSFLARRGYC